MSADNWAVCPRCTKQAENSRRDLEEKAKSAYGILPEGEYLALVAQVKQPAAKPEQTLREDYEIGILEDGEFYISYGAGCAKCGFTFEYNHTQQTG